jgi:uncharacterized protein (UPF0261 family)
LSLAVVVTVKQRIVDISRVDLPHLKTTTTPGDIDMMNSGMVKAAPSRNDERPLVNP